jgi:hypothetical protein
VESVTSAPGFIAILKNMYHVGLADFNL